MGTNFYRVNIPTEEDIKKLHKLVDEGKLLSRRCYWGEEDSESVQDIIDDCTTFSPKVFALPSSLTSVEKESASFDKKTNFRNIK